MWELDSVPVIYYTKEFETAKDKIKNIYFFLIFNMPRPLRAMLSIAVILLAVMASIIQAKHLPNHVEFPEYNERFFDDVKALIKRHLKEGSTEEISHLHFVSDRKENDGSIRSVYGNPMGDMQVPTPVLVENWPTVSHRFGQISAVAIDPEGNPVIFHRADRYWDANTFNESHIYHMMENGPIKEKTIYTLDPKMGAIKYGWGEDFFYMPHGMTIDTHGNYWLTDVAMHQAFKFKPNGEKPLLVIGKRFRPGTSVKHLCKPTSIAVATTGEFYNIRSS
ncbi:peptidyl-alpha-hydroxyglycine-alpha-amidating lyase 2 [Haematobia irritans]|uniref:peptidyl-alpha-hydroxyglycine-alpha-amidating lyase 2 n=1 Tax=Haematobia irritans TaxID=7368 RepID=UPI003F4FFBFE